MTGWFVETSQWKKDQGLGSCRILAVTGQPIRQASIIKSEVDAHGRGIKLVVSRMIFLALLLVPTLLFAREASQVDDYYNSGFQRSRKSPPPQQREAEPRATAPRPTNPRVTNEPIVVQEEAEEGNSEVTGGSSLAPSRVPRPVVRPDTLQRPDAENNPFQIEPADPEIRFDGEPDFRDYAGTGAMRDRDRNAPAFAPFSRAFRTCGAQLGCTGASMYICRGSSCRNNSGSCHNSGRAIDVSHIICGGRRHDTFAPIFSRFVRCIGQQRIGAGEVPDRTWRNMFQETASDDSECAGITPANARTHPKRTVCHWDHVHISMYCRNGRSY